jgi:acyl-CoA thioesterase I
VRKVIRLRAWFLALLLCGCRAAEEPATPTRTPRSDQGVIVAFGDSLTEGLGVEPSQSYPAQLQRALQAKGYGWKVVNAGLSGETSSGALTRLNWVLRSEPQVVILETGANDALRGTPPAVTEKNLDELVSRLRARQVKVLLAGMQTLQNTGPEYARNFAAIYPRVARRQGVTLMPFFLEGVAGKPELNQEDRLHPTAEGYRLITRRLLPYLEPLLRPQAPGS